MTRLGVLVRLSLAAVLAIAVGVAALPRSAAAAKTVAAQTCSTIASDKAITGIAGVKFVNAQLLAAHASPAAPPHGSPASGTANVSYCLVILVWGANATENITVYVGLPLNAADGGTTGSIVTPPWNFTTVNGNWNGRTEGIGGGVCTGNTNVTAGVNAGYAGSATDGGHEGGDCDPALVPTSATTGKLNTQFIEDFFHTGMKEEIILSKAVATAYYGMKPLYNYWNGCSTGGRQGYAIAQDEPSEVDGILASAPAMFWSRFITAEMWGQVVMFHEAGEDPAGAIPSGKEIAVQQAAIAYCDPLDGVTDGIIDDPRTCPYDATWAICGSSGNPAPPPPSPNCLTEAEASVINQIWAGPKNQNGDKIWYGINKGSDFFFLDGTPIFSIGETQLEWDTLNPEFSADTTPETPGVSMSAGPGVVGEWQTIAVLGGTLDYPHVAEGGSKNTSDLTDTFATMDAAKAAGTKILTFVGANDQLIMPEGVIGYYREMAQRYKLAHDGTGFDGVQQFYRLFRVPGIGHCGLGILFNGSNGPWPQNGADFDALINWVENGIAPTNVIGQGSTNTGQTITRPNCLYPQTAVFDSGTAGAPGTTGGSSIYEAANWVCKGNVDLAVRCQDALVQFKQEVSGPINWSQTGLTAGECSP